MDCIPDLLLDNILSFFTIEEKFKLKLVCKRWLNFIESQYPKRLVLKSEFFFVKEIWADNSKEIKESQIIDLKFFEKFLSTNYFFQLKVLYIHVKRCELDNPVSEKKMESFRRLIQKLDCLCLDFQVDSFLSDFSIETIHKLDFDKLKILKIEFDKIYSFMEPFRLFIKASNLERLISLISNRVRRYTIILSNPEKILSIECLVFDNTLQIDKFSNLKQLTCKMVGPDFDLSNYPKLKRLDLCPAENEIDIARKIDEQRKKLGLQSLEFFLFGFKLKNGNDFFVPEVLSRIDKYYRINKKELEMLRGIDLNLDSNNPFPWRATIVLSDEIKYLSSFSNYISKLNVGHISVDFKTAINFKHTLEFLKLLNGLNSLTLLEPKQEFLDELETVRYILDLRIYFNKNYDFKCENWKFLTKIKKIYSIKIHHFTYPVGDLFDSLEKLNCKLIDLACHYFYYTYEQSWSNKLESSRHYYIYYLPYFDRRNIEKGNQESVFSVLKAFKPPKSCLIE